MSQEKQIVLERNSEGLRSAPYYEETKLPILPRKRDCVGEACPVSENVGACFISTHHLFFAHKYFMSLGYPYDVLVNDPNAMVDMAHCRHSSSYPNSWHKLYDFTAVPDEEVAARYIEESRVLQRLDVLVTDMSSEIDGIFTDSVKKRYRLFGQGTYQKRVERFQEKKEEYNSRAAEVGEIEIIPSTIVGGLVTQLGTKRRILQKQLDVVPELASSSLRIFRMAA